MYVMLLLNYPEFFSKKKLFAHILFNITKLLFSLLAKVLLLQHHRNLRSAKFILGV